MVAFTRPGAVTRRDLLKWLAPLFVSTLSWGARMKHVALLGDSVFDNGAYIGNGPDVAKQLRAVLGGTVEVTLAAVDGSTISDIPGQLDRIGNASHLVISVGGNDALLQAGVLDEPVQFVTEALTRIAAIQQEFQRAYRQMLDTVIARRLTTAVCTIYDRTAGRVGLAALNDCITREAFRHGVDLIDLRLICNEDAVFASAIEPSVEGGAKIARAIQSFVVKPAQLHRSEVFSGPN